MSKRCDPSEEEEAGKALLNEVVDGLKRKKRPVAAAEEDRGTNFMRILYGDACAGVFLSFKDWDINGIENNNNALQCLVPFCDITHFLSDNPNAIDVISFVPNLRILLKVVRLERVKTFMEASAEVDSHTKLYKPVILLAAEYSEWSIVSAILERNIALTNIDRNKYSRKILTYISQSCSKELINSFINSPLNIGLNFTEAILLAYESQRPEVIDFILSLELHFDVRSYDFRLAIEIAISYLDVEFLKFLHERGVEGGRLVNGVDVDEVNNFLQACFDLANDPIAPEDAASLVFPYDPSTVLISFIPACIEGLIRHSRSPLTCINSLLKAPSSIELDDNNLQVMHSSAQPSFVFLFTYIMRHPLYDATVLKRLLQLWVATKRAAKRVEEEREDLLNFCKIIEDVVLAIFSCDATNRDDNLLPLIRMQKVENEEDILHQLESYQQHQHRSLQYRRQKSLSARHVLRTSDKFHAHDMRWIFGEESFIKLALDKKFKVAFAVPQINRLVLLIFDSARFESQESYFQERFYPQILFYIDMSMRIITFILIATIAINEYPLEMNLSYSAPRKFVSFSGTEVFLVLFLIAEIIHELGEFLELRQELVVPDNVNVLPPNRLLQSQNIDGKQLEGEETSGEEGEEKDPETIDANSTTMLSDTSQTSENEPPLSTIASDGAKDMPFPEKDVIPSSSSSPTANNKPVSKIKVIKTKSPKESKRARRTSRAFSFQSTYSSDTISTSSLNVSLASSTSNSSGSFATSYYSVQRKQQYQQRRHLRRLRRKRELIHAHMRDDWNFIDLVNCVGGLLWFILRCIPSQFIAARVTLSLLAIPWSIGLLRFFSINKTLGELVIIIRAMLQDLTAFVIVYVVMIAGFGVAFRGLFADSVVYATMSDTFLALFSGTLSNFSFDVYNTGNRGVNTIGIILTLIFVVMTAIMLINLLIAKMSTSFQRVSDKSQMEWAFERAKLVRSLTLIREKDVWNILPAPLNLVPIVFTMGGLADWNVYQRRHFSTYQRQLISIPSHKLHHQAFSKDGILIASLPKESTGDINRNNNDDTNIINKHDIDKQPEKEDFFLVSIRGTIANITLFFIYFPLAKILEVCIAFAYTFFIIGRDDSGSNPPGSMMNMSPWEFLHFLLMSVFYLIIYIPLFVVEMVRSLSKGEWISRPWVSYLFEEDQHLVSHTEKYLLLEAVRMLDQPQCQSGSFSLNSDSTIRNNSSSPQVELSAMENHGTSKSINMNDNTKNKNQQKVKGDSQLKKAPSSFFSRSAYALIKDNYTLYPPGWDFEDLHTLEENKTSTSIDDGEDVFSDEEDDGDEMVQRNDATAMRKRQHRRRKLLHKYSIQQQQQQQQMMDDDSTVNDARFDSMSHSPKSPTSLTANDDNNNNNNLHASANIQKPLVRIFKDEDIDDILKPFMPSATAPGLQAAAATATMTMLLVEEQAQKLTELQAALSQAQQEQQQMKKMHKEMYHMLRTFMLRTQPQDTANTQNNNNNYLNTTTTSSLAATSFEMNISSKPSLDTKKSSKKNVTKDVDNSSTAAVSPKDTYVDIHDGTTDIQNQLSEKFLFEDSTIDQIPKRNVPQSPATVPTPSVAQSLLINFRPHSISFKRQRSSTGSAGGIGNSINAAPAATTIVNSAASVASSTALSTLPQRHRPPLPPPPKPLRKQTQPNPVARLPQVSGDP